MKKKILYIFLIFFFFPINNVFSIDNKLLKNIENYLNELNNISSEFVQSTSSGTQDTGKILISKPGKLRIEYKGKNKLLIVADGKWLHYFDIELNEVQSLTIKKSPAWILLKKNIDLKNDFNINKLEKKKG